LKTNVLKVVLAFNSDLQRYADGRLPSASATNTGKISNVLPLKILAVQVAVWGVELTNNYP
jgi:hypothetical protein